MIARAILPAILSAVLLAPSLSFSQGVIPFPGRPAAPVFTLSDVGGKSVSLEDLRKKTVLLAFWQTT